MDIDDASLFSWQRLPGSGYPIDQAPLTPDSTGDRMRLGSLSFNSYHEIIPTIEHDEEQYNGDGYEDDTLRIPEIGCKSIRPATDSWDQPVRKNTGSGTYLGDPGANPYEARDTVPELPVTGAPKEKPIVVSIPQSTLMQPRSLFDGYIPLAPEIRESHAITLLLDAAKSHQSLKGHIEFDLQNFSVYLNSNIYPYEFRSLHQLAIRPNTDQFYFDGVLSYGETRFYLRKIPFRQLPIGNYGSKKHTVGDQIWIRSTLNETRGKEIYYKLGTPSTEYARFYEPFLWIADLAKHVFDYCKCLRHDGRQAVLEDFKSRFGIWLLRKHLKSSVFERWHAANLSSDYRGAIIANIQFIWKEAHGLDPDSVTWHGFWDEVKNMNYYKPNLSLNRLSPSKDDDVTRYDPTRSRKHDQVPPTVVTPYVYDLFSHMVFGDVLEHTKLTATTENKQKAFLQSSGLAEQRSPPAVKRNGDNREAFIASIEIGDVISTKPDDEETGTQWKQSKSKHYEGEHLWFGLIQKVHQSPNGKRSFDVIWLYQSIDTPCGIMKYPYNNELFLSNNCTCHHNTAKIQAEEVLSTHSVEWFGSPSTSAEFFVRQTYLSDDCRWTTLRKQHLTCDKDSFDKNYLYKVGDTVLVETNPKALQLETFIVEEFFDENDKHYARLRKLSRRKEIDKNVHNAPPNELVYTEQFFEISSRRIFRHCLVRAFLPEEEIPTPYDCGGTGDLFFMTHQEIETNEGKIAYVPLDMGLISHLRQGFDPSQVDSLQKLQGLDLFCGGGNYGRGLEEGGGIEMRWANDIWSEAIHTYMANSKVDTCTPFLGSVDKLLLRALKGDDAKVPQPGDVHFISAGSPCPGFSRLTPDRTTNAQRKNQSLVASFASFVDLYRPYYGILENVPHMVNTKNFRDACVFSQLVCSLVGLGYQVQVMFLDAWSFGAPQARSRVFLCFTAPGFRMPKVPAPSHSHPPGTKLATLGEMSCGRPFDRRVIMSTPFKFVSAGEATADLPDIRDGKPDYCVGFPDHRLSMGYTPPLRKQIFSIPIQPWGMNFSKAWFGRPDMPPVMSEADRQLFPTGKTQRIWRSSKGWGRIRPDRIFGTVATQCTPTDTRMGANNHWTQPRPLTIMEIRRAQGFRDHEVLVGEPRTQWRIVGNSVARQVSLALGLAVREAWFGTLFDEGCVPQRGLDSSTEEDTPTPKVVTEDRSSAEVDIERQWQMAAPRSATVVSEDLEMRMEIDRILGIGTTTEEEENSSSTYTPADENPFLVPTPPPPRRQQKSLSTSPTPATSESEAESGIKRPSSLYVGILAKRQRVGEDRIEAGEQQVG